MNQNPGLVKQEAIDSNFNSNNAHDNATTNVVNATTSVTSITKEFQTPNSIRKTRTTFQSFPIVNTPTPPSRFRKIVNPFEIGIADRLHLPAINR